MELAACLGPSGLFVLRLGGGQKRRALCLFLSVLYARGSLFYLFHILPKAF